MEALAPFRAPFIAAEGDPQPLPYLDDAPAVRETRSTSELSAAADRSHARRQSSRR